MKKNNRFLIASLRDTVGTNVAFHGIGGRGYPTDVSKAEVFTRDQAQKFWNSAREFDLPISADHVEQLVQYHVDCQYIPNQTVIQPGCTQYVGYLKGRWDGNDVFWLTSGNGKTNHFDVDFELAKVFSEPLDYHDVVWIPFALANEKKRKTFALGKINKRTMIQGCGLVTPDHVKRSQRKKPHSGKTRVNCPKCGKIAWQRNPYEVEECERCRNY